MSNIINELSASDKLSSLLPEYAKL